MDKKFPDPQALKDSFKKVNIQKTYLEQECQLLQEANSFDMPLDSYRKMFDIYSKGRIDEPIIASPKINWKKWWLAPQQYARWLSRINKKYLLGKGVNFVIEKGVLLTIAVGVFQYIKTIPEVYKRTLEQKKQTQYQAWQIVNSTKGNSSSSGRIQALQDLNEDKISLSGISADQAYLIKIDLREADLEFASLKKARLSGANLYKADFWKASLQGTNFYGASLRKAAFNRANLQGAIFNEADLEGAIFKEADIKEAMYCKVKNLTVEQVKAAKNWDKAYYDLKLRNQLGLASVNLIDNKKQCEN
jgi:BTB/POZ domain-containing protein KCTD9